MFLNASASLHLIWVHLSTAMLMLCLRSWVYIYIHIYIVAPVAYQVILEPGIGQFFVSSNPPECILVQIRADFFLCTN